MLAGDDAPSAFLFIFAFKLRKCQTHRRRNVSPTLFMGKGGGEVEIILKINMRKGQSSKFEMSTQKS